MEIEKDLAELKSLLLLSANYQRATVRPAVVSGITTSETTGNRFFDWEKGPVTIVTFYVCHQPEEASYRDGNAIR